jgi:hypothetical protein
MLGRVSGNRDRKAGCESRAPPPADILEVRVYRSKRWAPRSAGRRVGGLWLLLQELICISTRSAEREAEDERRLCRPSIPTASHSNDGGTNPVGLGSIDPAIFPISFGRRQRLARSKSLAISIARRHLGPLSPRWPRFSRLPHLSGRGSKLGCRCGLASSAGGAGGIAVGSANRALANVYRVFDRFANCQFRFLGFVLGLIGNRQNRN